MKHYYNQNIDEILQQFGVSVERGLSKDEAKKRLEIHGPNRLETTKQNPLYKSFDQFKGSMVTIFSSLPLFRIIGLQNGEGF